MFRSARDYRTFLTLLLTYTLDLVGFSIVFPVLAPLLLNPELHFFQAGTLESMRTTVLGLIYAVFGIAQFVGAPVVGAIADHYGRYKTFLLTIALSVAGYAVMAMSLYVESLGLLFLGRMMTGLCSGNFTLAQSAAADLTDEQHRTKVFGILMGIGGLGFVAGPWFGGILANPDWLHGSGAFIFATVASMINFFVVLFFFVETFHRKHLHHNFFQTFKDLRYVFHNKILRDILSSHLLYSIGWGFFLIFSPTFLVQRFSLDSTMIGNVFAYMALVWFFIAMFLNKELVGKVSLRALILIGGVAASSGVALFVWPAHLWPYWFIIPIAMTGGALVWVNIGALVSLRASKEMQGRALGASGSSWSIGQIIAPLAAGPLAGWNLYSPLLIGAVFIFASFLFFLTQCRER